MSLEEDVELRDLVTQTLEANGCLGRTRAELRASIFLALDEDVKVSKKQPLLNNKVKTYLDTADGQTMFCIVKEFLEFFNLYFTLSVYEPESYLGTGYQEKRREEIAKDLGIEENVTVPILLQLIKIAQTKSKNMEINLSVNGVEDESTNNSEVESANSKTDSSLEISQDKASIEEKISNKSAELMDEIKTVEKNNMNATFNVNNSLVLNHSNLDNKTFDLNSPSGVLKKALLDEVISENVNDVKSSRKTNETLDEKVSSKENDDTYEDTSSITEDSVAVNAKVPNTQISNGGSEVSNDAETFSPPIVKESKPKAESNDKIKNSSQKSDKIKSKNSLSSLADLPPLQINKSRVSDILPSLYSKEFKEKSNIRDLDKLFDMEAEYEEDFMCSGEMDLSGKSDYLISEHSQKNSLHDLEEKSNISDGSKSKDKLSSVVSIQNNLKDKTGSNSQIETESGKSTSNSISENLEYNSNTSE